MDIGNSFGAKTLSYGHARKVWREIRHVFPAGGTVTNLSSWTSAGKIPAGTPCKYDPSAKTITPYPTTTVTGTADATALAALGINGYTQEDIYVDSNTTKATGTVVYDGELYDFMYSSTLLAKLQAVTTTPHIVWVH